jgi:Uma2 family endonuclease
MAEQTASSPSVPADAVPQPEPVRVTADEYMEHYAHDFYEWVDGELIEMSPVTDPHSQLMIYFLDLLRAFFLLKPIGTVKIQPFVMRIDVVKSRREPDLQVILDTNSGQLTKTAMIGPADIITEIVSEESVERDYGKKFVEYEKGGVQEYWLIDILRNIAHFYQLNVEGVYKLGTLDEDDNYQSPLLPGLKIHVPTFWQEPLPDMFQVGEIVKAMMAGE